MKYELIVALIFYAVVILLIYINRKKFDIQGKVIALYRMKLGLKSMDKIATKVPRLVEFLGIIGIVVGFIGMIAIVLMLIYGAYAVFFVPGAPPSVAPVLPGIPIPGSPVTIPLISGILVIFVVAAVHEFSHGVVARKFKYTVKNTGIVFFGPIVGAFVEPDEKKLDKAPLYHKLSIFAAGSFSNVLLAIVGVLLLIFVFLPANAQVIDSTGINVLSVQDNFPAIEVLEVGDKITAINGKEVLTRLAFAKTMETVDVGETITLTTQRGTHNLTPSQRPNGEGAYIGVTLQNGVEIKESLQVYKWPIEALFWLTQFFQLLVLISLGIGLFNLAPLGPIDGGRMLLATLEKFLSPERAKKIWVLTSIFLLLILVLNFIPFLKALFGLVM